MSKKLVIVESPHKSKTIEKYLGKDFKVVSSVGHIRDLSTSGKYGFGVDIDNNFKLDNHNYQMLIYGYGSDGMVGTSKDIPSGALNITG